MASVSSAHLILFIASIVVATAVAGTVIVEVGQVGDAIEMRGDGVADDIETEITIINDENRGDAVVDEDNGTVTIYAKNIGSGHLAADPVGMDAFVDGSYTTIASVERIDDPDATEWGPGSVVAIELELEDGPDPGDELSVVIIVQGAEGQTTLYYHGEQTE